MIAIALSSLLYLQEHKQPQGPPEEKTPAVDRSGEPALKALLAVYGTKRDFSVLLIRGTRDSGIAAYAMESTIELRYFQPGTFRVEANTIWSDGRVFVADGASLLLDPLYADAPLELRDLKPGVVPNDRSLGPGGDAFSPFYWLLDGEAGIERWAEPGAFIRIGRLGAFRHVIQSSSRSLGTIWITVRDLESGPEVTSIAWDGTMRPTTPFTLTPTGAATVDYVAPLGDSGKRFSTAPEPGIAVNDRRAPKKPATVPKPPRNPGP
ncbi:MAG TPA: hypothetical protein PLH94_11400 [Fimbriimonadaceae bacterium]|nr:hypothetical protein [Fimbriimonadaceae bacterium]